MKRRNKWIRLGLSLCLAAAGLGFIPEQTVLADSYPNEVLLGAFWESDKNNTDTLYWSTDGINFYQLAEAYTDATPDSEDSAFIEGTPYPVSTLHDPSIIYKDGYFWMLSGFTDTNAKRFVPMIGYSKDLVNWSYPNSGSKDNVSLQGTPPGQERYETIPKADGTLGWDMVAPDFMLDDDGTVWITMCAGYYAQFHPSDGKSENDIMQPYLLKATGLSVPADGDPIENKGAPPVVTYSDAVPINLPTYNENVTINNRIDSSLYKEGNDYYLVVKKDGVTIEIWKTQNLTLESCQNPDSWELVCDDAVTGFEGPCLTKYRGQYYLYTDKLADYPPENHDGLRGVHVSVASTETTGKLDQFTGWLEDNQKKIVGWAADGTVKDCRHGTVISITDPDAIKVIWDLRSTTRYADKNDTPQATAALGWYQKESYKAPRYGSQIKQYWYENDVRQGLVNRGKEIFDPGTVAWYWLDSDNDGAMAKSKDVYLPIDKEEYNADPKAYEQYNGDPTKWKWVRYDHEGKMIKGQDHRPIPGAPEDAAWGYWYFDPITGAMTYGLTEIPTKTDESGAILESKWVYYDKISGLMLYGYHEIDGRLYYFDIYDGTAIDGWYRDADGVLYWYEKGQRQGYKTNDPSYRGKEIYDPLTNAWYWLDNDAQGKFAQNKDVYLPTDKDEYAKDENAYGSDPAKWKWVRYNENGHMIKGWNDKDGNRYYFDPITGAMEHGTRMIDGVIYHFDEMTGILVK